MTKVCGICGEKFETTNRRKKYCCEQCKVEANRIHNRKNYYVEKPSTGKHCNHKDCLYYNDYPNHCDYNYLTGKLRGCKSGNSCTRYKKATESERKKYRNKILREDEQGRNRSITVSYYCESLPQCDVYRRYNKLVGKK